VNILTGSTGVLLHYAVGTANTVYLYPDYEGIPITITDTGLGTDIAYLLGEVLIDGLNLEHALTIHITEPTTISSKPIPDELPSRTYLGKQGRSLEITGWVPTVAELNTLSALADGTVHYIQLPTGTRVPVHIIQAQPTRPIDPNEYPYVISAVEVTE